MQTVHIDLCKQTTITTSGLLGNIYNLYLLQIFSTEHALRQEIWYASFSDGFIVSCNNIVFPASYI